jgi:hypothetical protein
MYLQRKETSWVIALSRMVITNGNVWARHFWRLRREAYYYYYHTKASGLNTKITCYSRAFPRQLYLSQLTNLSVRIFCSCQGILRKPSFTRQNCIDYIGKEEHCNVDGSVLSAIILRNDSN